jgi:hypothetical protein
MMRAIQEDPETPEKREDPGDSSDLTNSQMRLDFDDWRGV